MASITHRPNGHYWVQFLDRTGARKKVRLGAVPKGVAEEVRRRVEGLLGY